MEVGDEVWSYDAKTGTWGWRTVTKTFVHHHEGVVYRLGIGGEWIDVTGNHPVCVAAGDGLAARPVPLDIGTDPLKCGDGGRWVEAGDVLAGDTVVGASGAAIVTSVTSYEASLAVYNISVAGSRTYAVSAEGLLVHNKPAVAPPTVLFKPTQTARHFDFAKVDRYADAMRKGTWDWSADKIIVDKVGNIVSGHHRVLAAERAGVQIPESAIFRLNTVTPRPVYDWSDILP